MRKCGTCSFGQPAPGGVECHGMPPTVFLVPGLPGLDGKPRMMAQKIRPPMELEEPGCHLWEDKEKPAFGITPSGEFVPLPQKTIRAGGVVLR